MYFLFKKVFYFHFGIWALLDPLLHVGGAVVNLVWSFPPGAAAASVLKGPLRWRAVGDGRTAGASERRHAHRAPRGWRTAPTGLLGDKGTINNLDLHTVRYSFSHKHAVKDPRCRSAPR